MNREIKFRAWATIGEEMIDLKAITPLALAEGILDGGDGLFIPFREDIILMQFTGLLDKNGKEIYEGDICTFYNKYAEKSYTRVVRYCSKFACFGLYPDMIGVWDYESDWLKISNIEIIGNIYENPELLN